MWQQVAEGTMTELKDIGSHESAIAEGQRGRLTLNLRTPVPTDVKTTLQSALEAQRVTGAQVSSSRSTISITYLKGFPWLPVIAAAILSIIILAILIVSWQLFREVAAVIPSPVITVAIVVGILGLLLAGYLIYKAGRE